ncbi:RusA family crossover junction endodeoxyribonuclease [Lentilactobacillus senioris]|uniref:RusA family crossover junction endodeoxyribonuclease n=1 Tax=Lentilactobacillus senioris TaxID=931534 RepID=UPI003D2921C6
MTSVFLTIYGEPVSAGRPRFTRQGHAYDPAKSRSYKRMFRLEAGKQFAELHQKPFSVDQPIEIYIAIYRPIQKSVSKAERTRRLLGEHMPVVKPDTDNYVKIVLDSLNGLIWDDDRAICHIDAWKYYSDDPRVEVIVKEMVPQVNQT